MALNNTSFESDIGGPIRKSTSIASLASSAYIGSWFVLDVAGKEFRALKTALTREPCSFLAKIVEDDIDTEQLAMDSNGLIVYMPDTSSGRWQLDTSPEYFEYILKYLRTGKFNGVKSEHSLEDLLDEAEMFRLTKFVDILRQKIFEKNTISTSTTPSETSIFASNLVKPTPPSSIYNNQFVPPSQLSRPPGLFPPSTGHQPPPTLYNQPPPGFENFNINQQQQSNQLLDTFEEERVFSETSSDQNFKIIDVSDKEDDNLESKFNSKNFRVPAFELTIDGIVRNYAKILPVRKRHTQEFLKYLSQSDKSLEFNYFSKFGVEMGCVLFYLQRLALLYPEGCTIKQYCDYELIQKNARPSENNQCFNNTVPSVVLLLQAGDLLKFDDKGKICVAEAVCKVKLICLRQNLCSNLFRFLLRRKQYRAPVQLLLEEMKLMVPSNVESQPDSRCLLSICNRFPAVFELICNKSDNFDFYRSSIALNEAIIKKDDNLYWRIVLDCEYSNINYFDNEDDINNNYGSCFCDCENCQSLVPKKRKKHRKNRIFGAQRRKRQKAKKSRK